MLLKEEKTEIIEKNRTHENDTGSPEVQIAILTKRINDLTAHLKSHKNDHRAFTEQPQRSSFQKRSAEDGWSQKKPAELPEEEGR